MDNIDYPVYDILKDYLNDKDILSFATVNRATRDIVLMFKRDICKKCIKMNMICIKKICHHCGPICVNEGIAIVQPKPYILSNDKSQERRENVRYYLCDKLAKCSLCKQYMSFVNNKFWSERCSGDECNNRYCVRCFGRFIKTCNHCQNNFCNVFCIEECDNCYRYYCHFCMEYGHPCEYQKI